MTQIPTNVTHDQINRLLRGHPLEEPDDQPAEQPVFHGSADGGAGNNPVPRQIDVNSLLRDMIQRGGTHAW